MCGVQAGLTDQQKQDLQALGRDSSGHKNLPAAEDDGDKQDDDSDEYDEDDSSDNDKGDQRQVTTVMGEKVRDCFSSIISYGSFCLG